MSALNGVTSAIVGAANVASGGSSFQVDRSLRFNSADSAYLNRTPSSAGNRKTWTWSGWVKRSKVGAKQQIFGVQGSSDTTYAENYFASDDKLYLRYGYNSVAEVRTTQVFRDPSAWLHVVIAFDVTQSTNTDKLKLYINGSEVTDFSTDSRSSFSNQDYGINRTGAHKISGEPNSSSSYLDAYLADVHFIDGQALDPTNFGETDDNNNWNPKNTSGLTFGTNGFHLKFADNSSTSALGTDSSGNSNTWTVNNISVTPGSGNDSLIDTPTNYEAGSGNNGGNYCTLNPLDQNGGTLSNGNLDYDLGSGTKFISGTIAVNSGKWYWEAKAVSGVTNGTVGGRFSISQTPTKKHGENGPFTLVWHATSGIQVFESGSYSTVLTGTNYSDGDTLGLALDADANIAYFYKNGSLAYTYDFSSKVAAGSEFLTPSTWNGSSGTPVWSFNFGQRSFDYTPRTNHKSLCSQNFADPTVADGGTAFDQKLWTGTSSARSITGYGFAPDFVWIKRRNATYGGVAMDIVRGLNSGNAGTLYTNSTAAEDTGPTSAITSFNSDGFDLGTDGGVNYSGSTYVGWAWDAGTSTASNSEGSITSQVRANTSAGVSIITYTGTGSNATFGHGLGATPSLVIVKSRSNAQNWAVYHASNSVGGATAAELYAYLNSGNEVRSTGGGPFWNNTAPTSSVVSVGTDNDTNANGYTYVSYCFAPVEGFSNFGVYEGNGSTDGPFVYTGFRPRWVMAKSETYAGNWNIFDASRPAFNETDGILRANTDGAEFDGSAQGSFSIGVDLLSNGFKLRQAGIDANQSGQRLIYAAFAEHPFKTSRAR